MLTHVRDYLVDVRYDLHLVGDIEDLVQSEEKTKFFLAPWRLQLLVEVLKDVVSLLGVLLQVFEQGLASLLLHLQCVRPQQILPNVLQLDGRVSRLLSKLTVH